MQRCNHITHSLNPGRLTRSRYTCDTDAHRLARIRQATLDNLLRLGVVVGIVALDKGYRLREDGDVAIQDSRHILVGCEATTTLLHEVGVYNRLLGYSVRYRKCAIVVHIAVLTTLEMLYFCV